MFLLWLRGVSTCPGWWVCCGSEELLPVLASGMSSCPVLESYLVGLLWLGGVYLSWLVSLLWL